MTEQADYIIVGGGSAGCVLADRLSENGRHRVLLIEAGGAGRHPSFHIPVGYVENRHHPRGNWLYRTEPEAGTANRALPWPRGKVLGGCSAINGLLYIRGQAQDYDHWRDLSNGGWGWDDLLPYFIKSEDQARGSSPLHGTGGPLHISDPSQRHPLSDAFIQAAEQWGLKANDDFNGPTQDGAGYFQITVKNGRRQSTAVAYLKRARHRPNLRILTHALAERLILEGNRAVGLRYSRHGQIAEIRATREVIVAAGAVNSPQLLQLSGIGPAELLRSHGIKVIRDLPGVGANLQDHYIVDLKYRVAGAVTVNEQTRGPRLVWEVLKYLATRKGLLSMSAAHVSLFLSSQAGLDRPDLQFHYLPATLDSRTNEVERLPGITLGPCQLRPDSRGSIQIASADPRRAPLIRPRYLEAETDQRVVVQALKIGRAIAAQPVLAPYLKDEISPGGALTSDAELLDFARSHGRTLYHPAGTCRMGTDADAVVDAALGVRGIGGLRVVDASIMPTLISGNTNAPVIAIAERAADLILAQTA